MRRWLTGPARSVVRASLHCGSEDHLQPNRVLGELARLKDGPFWKAGCAVVCNSAPASTPGCRVMELRTQRIADSG